MKQKNIRTCLGCRRKDHKSQLIRFSLNESNTPVIDQNASLEGRGVYCCKNQDCVQSFFKYKKRLARAFRREIADGIAVDLLKLEKLLVSGSIR